MIRLNVGPLIFLITIFTAVEQSHAGTKSRSLEMIGVEFSEALKYTDAKMWDEASRRVDDLNNSVAFDILQWLKLRAGSEEFSEYESFLLVNRDWPGISLLRSQGEKAIDSSIEPNRILKYFEHDEPLTANGSLKLAEIFLSKQEIKKAQEVMKQSWLDHPYSPNELKRAFKLWDTFLKENNKIRIDNLLWSGRVEEAEQMLPFLSNDVKELSKARIALKKESVGVDLLVRNVPSHLKADPGLLFDRFSYRKNKNLHRGAEEILLKTSRSAKALGKPKFWVKGRSAYARKALIDGKPEKAYEIVSNHFLDFSNQIVGKEVAELEWLSGFIAFEFFEDYQTALKHFKNFFENTVNPINVAKASYWIGRTYEKLLAPKKMMAAFSRGAKYQTTFYGQLSAERGNIRIDRSIFNTDLQHDWESAEFMKSSTVKSAILLYHSGRSVLADRFFNHASENLKKDDRLKLSQLAYDLGLKATGLSIAKTAGKTGIFYSDFLFPEIENSFTIDQELKPLVSSIIRQESGFFSHTKSSAGALGLMQVMPRTASSMSKKLGLSFSERRLLLDKNYNVKIGTFFLKTLLKKFEGSKILAISAYNAGPSRVRQWIDKFGDPREKGIDPLVWIELIPFVETRSYVKRVMEADWVYQGKLVGEPVPFSRGRINFGHKF